MGSQIDLSAPGILPLFQRDTGGNNTTTRVLVPPFHQITIQCASALYVFAGLQAGDAAPNQRLEFDASASAAGVTFSVGGAEAGTTSASICCALQSGTATIRFSVEPPVVSV